MVKLGVNIDHVATLREARGEEEPSPVQAAVICENSGANSIVCHLREDRRHINDKDVKNIRQAIKGWLNLEISLNPHIVKAALRIKPDQVTIVPEKREEVTTEGGLNVVKNAAKLKKVIKQFRARKIEVSLFVEPNRQQIKKSKQVGASIVEIHTGKYARAKNNQMAHRELKRLAQAVEYARKLEISVAAGHGLKYTNARAVAQILGIEELNIGHSIVSHALDVGLGNAVREMLTVVNS